MKSDRSEPIDLPTDDADWLLQELVKITNDAGGVSGVRLTLVVEGALVSGELISGREFFDSYGKEWRSLARDSGLGEWAAKMYRRTGKELYQRGGDPNAPPPAYVHLRDAVIYQAGAAVPEHAGILWRGRISHVSGFSIGKLQD